MNRILLVLAIAAAAIGGSSDLQAAAAGTPSTITCSRVIIPACGTVNGGQQSFPNACLARRAGATNIVAGNCRPKQVFCLMIYLPVCAVKGGDRYTYANACEASNAGAKVVSQGQCGAHPQP